ncbi:hypothetical protein C4D39_09670 [Clostridium perfringens]
MAKKDIKFTLDTIDSRYSPVGTVKQLDSVFFYIKITENGVTKDLTGQTIKLFAIKEDKKIVEQTTKINITNQSEGLVEIELLNAAIQVHGFTYFELEISDSNGIISTADFILRVNKRVGSPEAIESTNEVSTLKEIEVYVAQAKQEIKEFKKLKDEMLKTNEAINNQESLREEAEAERIQAENVRIEADKQRDKKIDIEKSIRKNNNLSLLNKELADCFLYNENMWDGEDVEIVYEAGQTWKYKNFEISGFEVNNVYSIGLTTALNHVNKDYIIEIDGHSTKVRKTNETYEFTARTETITFRIQCIASEQSVEGNTATYSGIYIRKRDIAIKDSMLKKQYDISEIKRVDEFLEFPIFLMENKRINKTGGTRAWTNLSVKFDVDENTAYTISYENLIGNRLPGGKGTVICAFENEEGTNIGGNKDILLVGGEKKNTFITPPNTKKINLMFIVTLAETHDEEFEVVWDGVNFYKGENLEIKIKEKVLPTQKVKAEFFEAHLPKYFYLAIGYPLEIYHNAICRCANINNYIFVWKLPKGGGSAFRDKLLLNPKDNLNKTNDTLTLEVYDNNYNLIDTQTSTVHYIKPDSTIAPVRKRTVLCVGDSLTDISKWREEIYNRFNNSIESEKIEFLGTLGKEPHKHEGHSGWSLNSYLVNSQEGWNGDYKIRVLQSPTITPKKKYRFGNKIFEYEKTENEDGVIWVYFNRVNGSGYVTTSDSPCTEVDGSISGDKSIEFTDAQKTSFNPFYNSGFDCKHYSDTYLNSVIPDDVIIWLGTNGGRPSLNMKSVKTDVAEEMKKYKAIIDNIKHNWVNTKIFICYLHYRPNQDGMGNVDGLTCSKAWDNYIFEFNKQLFETFKGYPNVIFIPTGQTLDRVNNYYQKDIDINTRNDKKISVANDPVHPYANTGFMQFADTIFATYINNIN